jgi:hypothetical protein
MPYLVGLSYSSPAADMKLVLNKVNYTLSKMVDRRAPAGEIVHQDFKG